jgi:hypothetical protein
MLDVSYHHVLHFPTSSQHSDNANGRVFQQQFDDNSTLTTLGCIESCSALNYTIAGLEWSVQCMVRFACLLQKLA